MTTTVVCLIRDEGPYLLEWIAWYKLLGVDRILFYDNGSTDEGAATLSALEALGEIDVEPWPDRTGMAPQLDAYADSIARCGSEWIGFLDADEFLVLPRHPDLKSFLDEFPATCGAVGCNQRVVGSNGQAGFTPALVHERFPLGSGEDLGLNAWIKTLARTACIEAPGIHAPTLRRGDFMTADGDLLTLDDGQRSRRISHRSAYYNHYILRSVAEFQRKRMRGESNHPREQQHLSDKYSGAFFRAHDVAVSRDATCERLLPRLRAEYARLQSLA